MSTPLMIVPPITVTPAMLTACDVPETDYGEWAVGTTYALAARVIVAAAHKVYESLVAGNVGYSPASNPTKWIEVGPTNRWKLFDLKNSSATAQATSMSYAVTPGRVVNAVAALGVVAQSVTVTMTDPTDGVVYTKTVSLLGTIADAEWYAYFFGVVEAETQVVITDLPTYGSAAIQIAFSAATGDVSCASLLIGYRRTFGMGVLAGVGVGISDYSRKETNEFGDVELVQRAYSRRAELATLLLHTEMQPFINMLAANRAVPMVWIGHTRFAPTVVFGFYKSFDVTIEYTRHAEVTIDVEGMT